MTENPNQSSEARLGSNLTGPEFDTEGCQQGSVKTEKAGQIRATDNKRVSLVRANRELITAHCSCCRQSILNPESHCV